MVKECIDILKGFRFNNIKAIFKQINMKGKANYYSKIKVNSKVDFKIICFKDKVS